jgi:hypothetical protein
MFIRSIRENIYLGVYLVLVFLFCGAGAWTQGLMYANRMLYHWVLVQEENFSVLFWKKFWATYFRNINSFWSEEISLMKYFTRNFGQLLGVVGHVCNPSLGKKLARLLSQPMSWAWWCIPVIPATGEAQAKMDNPI